MRTKLQNHVHDRITDVLVELKKIIPHDYRIFTEFKAEDEKNIYFSISPDMKYLRATIYIYPIAVRDFVDKNFKDFDHNLCHEFSHIFTSEFADMAYSRFVGEEELVEANERLTERMGRLVYKIYSGKNGTTTNKKRGRSARRSVSRKAKRATRNLHK